MKFSEQYISKQYLCAFAFIFTVAPHVCDATKRLPRALRDRSAVQWQDLPKTTLTLPDLASIKEEDEVNRKMFLAPRFAIPKEVKTNPKNDGVWEALENGSHMWRYIFNSPGCKSLNFGFTTFSLAKGMELFIYDLLTEESLGPFTHKDNNENKQLWTRVIKSCNVVIELDIDEKTYPDSVELELGTVGIGYAEFGGIGAGDVRKLSGSCNVDVACSVANNWRNEVKSVAVYGFAGSKFCTGSMVNNVRRDKTPYFLTAAHCGITAAYAASVVVYWNYETSTCGGTPNGSLRQTQSGATHLLTNAPTDFSLLRLNSQPKPEWNVAYAGWDRRGLDAQTAVAIHHPNTNEKRISFEYDGTRRSSFGGTGTSTGDGTHLRVQDWDMGTTEPGSSGSPLFNEQHRIIGQLHGGSAACGNNLPDWYGSFSKSWESLSGLKSYLDPDQTSALFVETLPATTTTVPNRCGDLVVGGTEKCDGSSFATTCAAEGFPEGGKLACAGNCAPITRGCYKRVLVRSNLSRQAGAWIAGSIAFNYSTTFIGFTTSGVNGDADLYVRFGSPPTWSTYDCVSDSYYSNEQCLVKGSNKVGVYYYMIYAYGAFSGLNFKIVADGSPSKSSKMRSKISNPAAIAALPVLPKNSICGNGILESLEQCDGDQISASCADQGYRKGGNISCSSDCTLDTTGCYKVVGSTALSRSVSGSSLCSITLDYPLSSIVFQMSGGSGDADLYVSREKIPTVDNFGCRPYLDGNNEKCSMGNQTGTYFFMVSAYDRFRGVHVEVITDGDVAKTTNSSDPPVVDCARDCANRCAVSSGPGCADCDLCESAVCSQDSFCCNDEWDSACQELVPDFCS